MLSCCKCPQVSISPSGHIGLIAVCAVITNVILAAQLILFVCSGYLLAMSSIPQGAFASFKIRQGMEGKGYNKLKEEKSFPPVNKKLVDQSPLKYNSKMMNSIWGQYNRYSVHNMKKNTDANEVLLWAEQRLATATPPAFHVPGFTPEFFN